jgi:hypothetical protein
MVIVAIAAILAMFASTAYGSSTGTTVHYIINATGLGVDLNSSTDQTTSNASNAVYTITVTNNGTTATVYNLSVNNTNNADTALLNQTATPILSPGQSFNVTLTVGDSTPGNYTVTVNAQAQHDPNVKDSVTVATEVIAQTLLLDAQIDPYAVINGSNVSLYIDAHNFEAVWATIRRPDGSFQNVTLTDEANTLYGNTGLLGVYNVTFYANNSIGQVISLDDYFEAFRGILITLDIVNSSISGLNSTFISYYRNGSVAINSSAIGTYILELADTILDLEFIAQDSRAIVNTWGTNISEVHNKYIGIDKHNETPGYIVTYGITPEWNATNGTIRIYYDDLAYTNENVLQLHKCSSYNFTARLCTGSWEDVTSLSVQNTTQDYFEINVTSFSGFSIREPIPETPCVGCGSGGGGGGGGGGGDDSKEECIENWKCGPWNECFNGAQTRECIDLNNCGTTEYKPFERRTCYVFCTPKWDCGEWGECTPEGIQARECNDANACKTTRGRPAITQGCEYDFCSDGIQDNGEDGVDCGGSCGECIRPALERPKILELAEANILCTITPILAVVLLLMLILIKAAKIPPKDTRILGIINIILMICVLAFLLPFSGKPEGACMAVADSLPLIDEILLFFSVTFTIALIEAIAYLAIKRRHLPKGALHERKRDSKLLVLLILTGGMTLYALSRIAVKYVSESRYLGDATGALYIALVALVIIAVMKWESSKGGGSDGKTPPEHEIPARHAEKSVVQDAAWDLRKIASGISESFIEKEHNAAMKLQKSERKFVSNIRHAEQGIAGRVLEAEQAAGSKIARMGRKTRSALRNICSAVRGASRSVLSSVSHALPAEHGRRKTEYRATPIRIVMLKDNAEPRIPIPLPAKRTPPAKPAKEKKRKGPSAIQRISAAIMSGIRAHQHKAHAADAKQKPAHPKKTPAARAAPDKKRKEPSAIQRALAAIVSSIRSRSEKLTSQAMAHLEEELNTWKNRQASIDDELHDLEMQMSGILRYREEVLKSTDELKHHISGSRMNEARRNEIKKHIDHITGNVTNIEQKIKTLLDRKTELTKTREQANAQFKQAEKRMEEERNKLKRK